MARKFGSTNRPQFYTYVTEVERKEYAKWVKANYKKDPALARWYGDQLFGKAPQPLTGEGGKDLPQPILYAIRDNDRDKESLQPAKTD